MRAASDRHAAEALELGRVVRVQGRVGAWLEAVELSVTDLRVERDPDAEALHWCKVSRHRARRPLFCAI